MIAFLRGQFVQVTPAKLIVDVGGVGYEVNISLHTYEAISKKEAGQLHTYLHITENAQVLFGLQPASSGSSSSFCYRCKLAS
jgi:Holliday junction DNA helicase RuvA